MFVKLTDLCPTSTNYQVPRMPDFYYTCHLCPTSKNCHLCPISTNHHLCPTSTHYHLYAPDFYKRPPNKFPLHPTPPNRDKVSTAFAFLPCTTLAWSRPSS